MRTKHGEYRETRDGKVSFVTKEKTILLTFVNQEQSPHINMKIMVFHPMANHFASPMELNSIHYEVEDGALSIPTPDGTIKITAGDKVSFHPNKK